MPRLTRRQVLREAARVAGAAAAVAAGHELLRPSAATYPVQRAPGELRVIRPPGAVDEPLLVAGCLRCTRCQDACEPGAVQLFGPAHGRQQGTPYVDPSIAACTLCMKCTEVCPPKVLQPVPVSDRLRVRMASVELSEDLCLSHKARRIRAEQLMLVKLGRKPTESTAELERRGPCGECFTACPARDKAIVLEPGGFLAPRINPDQCTGCGLCEEICRAVVRGYPAIRVVPNRRMTV